MADVASDNVDVVAEEVKEKEEVDSATNEDETKEVEEEETEKENGDSCEKANGKKVSDDVDSAETKDEELVCPVKRKSAAGVDAAEEATDGISPEKKAKLDDTAAADVESNGDAKVAA